MVNLRNRTKLKRARDYLDSVHKHSCGTIVERYLTDEQHRKRMHDKGYTQTDMKEFDRTALEKKKYVATPE